ncbi:YkvA family protein [Fervidobacterium sp.]
MKESEYVDFGEKEYSEEDAKEVLRNEEKIESKVKRWGWNKELLEKLKMLFGIVKYALSGEFTVDKIKLAAIIGALIYILSPVDAVPDFIPVAGQADDLGVLIALLRFIADVIEDFAKFLKKVGK